MGHCVDLADVIEETRKFKRKLCTADIGFTHDEVFDRPFLDHEHLIELREKLGECLKNRSNADPLSTSLLSCVDRIIDAVARDPRTPSEDELCRRFSSGDLDARTVMHITKWSMDDLYDNCASRGLPPAF